VQIGYSTERLLEVSVDPRYAGTRRARPPSLRARSSTTDARPSNRR